jgi:hypothetical protein
VQKNKSNPDITGNQKRMSPAHLTRKNFYPNAENRILKPKEDAFLTAGRTEVRGT